MATSFVENEYGPPPNWLRLQAALVDAGTCGVALGPGLGVEYEEATVQSGFRALEGGELRGLLAVFERWAVGAAERPVESPRIHRHDVDRPWPASGGAVVPSGVPRSTREAGRRQPGDLGRGCCL